MMTDLPEVLSGEQVRCILHISKRKCAWMLNNGFIKYRNTGKMTRKYTVLKKDLLKYIEDSQRHPERYTTPHAEFSAAKYASTIRKGDLRKAGFPSSLPTEFRAWLEAEFKDVSDVLTISQIIAVTGYSDNSVDRWLSRGWLKAVQTQRGKRIPKEWLIDFYCGYGYTIAKMSDRHIGLMRKFFDEDKRPADNTLP